MKLHTQIFNLSVLISGFLPNPHITCSCGNQLTYKDEIAVYNHLLGRNRRRKQSRGGARTAVQRGQGTSSAEQPSLPLPPSQGSLLQLKSTQQQTATPIPPPSGRSKCPTCCFHTRWLFFFNLMHFLLYFILGGVDSFNIPFFSPYHI